MKKSQLRKLIREIIQEQDFLAKGVARSKPVFNKLRQATERLQNEQTNHACYDFQLNSQAQACCEKCASAGGNLPTTDPCHELTSAPAFGIEGCKCCDQLDLKWACASDAMVNTGEYIDGASPDSENYGDCVSSYNQSFPYFTRAECEADSACADGDSGGGITTLDPGKAPLSSKRLNRRRTNAKRR